MAGWGKYLREAREAADLSQEAVAELYQRDVLRVDIARKVPPVRVRGSSLKRRTASADVKAALVEAVGDRLEHPKRDIAIIEMLDSTGLRRSELAALRIEDIDLELGAVRVRDSKTGEARLSGVGAAARVALDEYFVAERGRRPGPLFLNRQGRALGSTGIQTMLKRAAVLAGVEVSAHDFRRACAARLLSEGVPLDVVAGQLGHSSSNMSLVYGREGRERRNVSAFHDAERGIRRLG